MKHLLALFFLLTCLFGKAQTNISGTINDYSSVSAVGANSITVNSTAAFNPGDMALIIQMKGATMDETNSSSFGDIVNYNNAGNYELITVCDVPSGTELSVSDIQRTYDPAQGVQLVRVPIYDNAVVTADVTGNNWDGSTGGVIALKCNGSLTLNANIDAQGIGFSGAPLLTSSYTCQWFLIIGDYFVTNASGQGALKGEGIANFITDKTAGKGAQTNGGGGGNDHNSGGGGGGNGGAGGQGGERIPQSTFFCSGQHPGVGGKSQTYNNTENRIFLGGGGGAGHENNAVTGTPGTNGGGIVIIIADTIYGNSNTILANGLDATEAFDGAGGGGAGGTILIDANNYTGALNTNISGGNGGDVNNGGPTNCNGPGGGGGGGVIWVSQASLDPNVNLINNGGTAGTTVAASQTNCTVGSSNNATDGSLGISVTSLVLPIPVPAATGTEVVSACQSYTWIDGYTYTADTVGAVYTYIGGATNGCDSTVTLDLTINSVDINVSQIADTLTSAQTNATSYQWIDCNTMMAIPGATSQTYISGTNGDFAVEVTANGCTDTSACITVAGLDLNYVEKEQILIYPIPASNFITIEFGRIQSDIQLSISTLSGQQIMQKSDSFKSKCDVPIQLNPGTYIITVRTSTSYFIQKIIVE